ncbi:hypothetical protein OROMI_021873 [Orobanche minor]
MAPKPSSSPSSSTSTRYGSIANELTHITSLNEFEPMKMRINPKNHKFFRILLWTKSAFDIKKSEIPPLVPDLPPFRIHGFNPVRVSQGDENHVISHNHIIQKGVFDQNKFRGNIIKAW